MWIHFVFFNIIWFGLILIGNGFIPIAIVWLVVHIFRSLKWRYESISLIAIAATGISIDMCLTALGVFRFNSDVFFPLWLVVLWFCFAATIGYSDKLLPRSKIARFIIGAIIPPFSYLAAEHLTAVQFGYPLWFTYALLSMIWAPLLIITIEIHRKSIALGAHDVKT